MPTITVSVKDLESLVGEKLPKSLDDIENLLSFVKAEVEDRSKDELKLEIKGNDRPDTWCVEGVARQLRGNLGIEKGIKHYTSRKSKNQVSVSADMKTVRPFIACATLRNVKLNVDSLDQITQLQEKIHGTYGRNRKKVSLGLYDMDLIKFPLSYKLADPKKTSFVPLGHSKKSTLSEILKTHQKGKEYGDLLHGLKKYPVVVDSNDKILSMPPIINSNDLGNVGTSTKNIVVECTGTDWEAVNQALTIICLSLVDRGGILYSCEIKYPYPIVSNLKYDLTPHVGTTEIWVRQEFVNKRLGTNFSTNKIVELLKLSRFGVLKKKSDSLLVEIPSYRADIMHAVDIIEDIAIAYTYDEFKPDSLSLHTIGGLSPMERSSNKIRDLCLGYGGQEIMTFTLTSPKILDLLEGTTYVKIDNPISETYSVLRSRLVPGVLDFLGKNTGVKYPQKVFEVGDCVSVDKKSENKFKTEKRVCFAISHDSANLTEIKSFVQSLLDSSGIKYSSGPLSNETFIPGRCGKIVSSGKDIGVFGEVHPEVLSKINIEMPVIIAEIFLGSSE